MLEGKEKKRERWQRRREKEERKKKKELELQERAARKKGTVVCVYIIYSPECCMAVRFISNLNIVRQDGINSVQKRRGVHLFPVV